MQAVLGSSTPRHATTRTPTLPLPNEAASGRYALFALGRPASQFGLPLLSQLYPDYTTPPPLPHPSNYFPFLSIFPTYPYPFILSTFLHHLHTILISIHNPLSLLFSFLFLNPSLQHINRFFYSPLFIPPTPPPIIVLITLTTPPTIFLFSHLHPHSTTHQSPPSSPPTTIFSPPLPFSSSNLLTSHPPKPYFPFYPFSHP